MENQDNSQNSVPVDSSSIVEETPDLPGKYVHEESIVSETFKNIGNAIKLLVGNGAEIEVDYSNVVEMTQGLADEISFMQSGYASKIEKYRQAYKDERDQRDTADYKLSVASEQRLVLIKEVKSLQLELDDCNDANDKLFEVNEELENVIKNLRSELESLLKIAPTTEREDVPSAIKNEDAGGDSASVEPHDEPVEVADIVDSDDDERVDNLPQHAKITTNKGVSGVVECATSDEEGNEETTVGDSGGDISIEVSSSSASKALQDALSVLEQSRKVRRDVGFDDEEEVQDLSVAQEENNNDPATPPVSGGKKTHGGARGKRFSVSSLLGGESLQLSDMIPDSLKQKTPADDNNTPLHGGSASGGKTSLTGSARKASIKLFSDIFNPGDDGVNGTEHYRWDEGDAAENRSSAPLPPADPMALGEVPTCFKCGGTVEGPKYSTCKCRIPQLTPDDSSSSTASRGGLGSLKSMINKGLSMSSKLQKGGGGGKQNDRGEKGGGNQLPVFFDPSDTAGFS